MPKLQGYVLRDKETKKIRIKEEIEPLEIFLTRKVAKQKKEKYSDKEFVEIVPVELEFKVDKVQQVTDKLDKEE